MVMCNTNRVRPYQQEIADDSIIALEGKTAAGNTKPKAK